MKFAAAELSRRDIPTIAQRFNAGLQRTEQFVPKGRLNDSHQHLDSAVPSGLILLTAGLPALKRRAIISHPSGMQQAACWLLYFVNFSKVSNASWQLFQEADELMAIFSSIIKSTRSGSS